MYNIRKELERRVLILDGGMGTMVQGYALKEEDFRGDEFRTWATPLMGCNDILVLTRCDVIERIHEAYLLAGADIISTNTFNANTISMSDYNLQGEVRRINRVAVAIAKGVAARFTAENSDKPRFVAGSIGPTSKTASMSADVNNPASRDVSFDDLVDAYSEQVAGMIDSDVDLFLVETIFDTLNAKAAIFAIEQQCAQRGVTIPIMLSATVSDASGRTLSGQTIEAFYASVAHCNPLSVGLNCGFGAAQLRPYLERLSLIANCNVSVHPNAGLPNVMGGYDETPSMMAHEIETYLKEGLVNIVGGCCGTTPATIGAIASMAKNYSPREVRKKKSVTTLSGLEPLVMDENINFVNIGERANVAGSAKFARLIRENKFEEALSVARQQVEAGAQIVDVCMDDGLIDGKVAMVKFLNLAMAEPEIASRPFMIDSSSWEILEAGLKCVQGKSVVNSISLKEGEEEFIRKARIIRSLGAAMVVMLFDEAGQADSYIRKVEVAQRSYDILMGIGFPPEDIIFDPNILSIGTGIEQHNNYGVDFIEACRYIKANMPYVKVSGGVSNLSFAFRGNNLIREAMHSAFLYHAIKEGMDMGLVNPAMLQIYSDIDPELLVCVEDLIFNRGEDAIERVSKFSGEAAKEQISDGVLWRSGTLEERIEYAMLKGVTDNIKEDTLEAYQKEGSALAVIDNLLMKAMGKVGTLFGEGKMFLPQVVKSARVMKSAVDVLKPYIGGGQESANAGTVVMATVKGDVHDIGKNIVSIVLSCNGYKIDDLGVMVDADKIVDRAESISADAIGLSGLITPSLEEMSRVATEMQRRGVKIPLLIGGATTSKMHTAVKIAPKYDAPVAHCSDASSNVVILGRLLSEGRDEFVEKLNADQQKLRDEYAIMEAASSLKPFAEAIRCRHRKDQQDVVVPNQIGRVVFKDYPFSEVEQYIDWNFFFPAWGIKGRYPEVLEKPDAQRLFDDAQQLLQRIKSEKLLRLSGVVGIFPARSQGEAIVLKGEGDVEYTLAQLRNQSSDLQTNLSLVDYVTLNDYVGAFMVTAGVGLKELVEQFRADGDDYNAIMSKLLADRLTEAFAESIHSFVRTTFWGYQKDVITPGDAIKGNYQGLRLAFGYPACPDHSLKREVFALLKAEESTSARLTENFMIDPGEALCGLMFADRDMKYFSVGKIDAQQMESYAKERGVDKDLMEKIIAQHI